ncbi:MAG TPA: hypothetical protein VGE52_19685, partial [Pirellulales bacterium]
GEAAAAARRARAGNGAGNPDNLNPAGGPNNGDGRPGRNPAGSPDGYAGTGATGPNGAPAPGGSGGAPPGSVGSGAGGGYASRSGQAGAQQGRPQWADPNQVDAGAAQNNDGPKLGEYVEPRDAPRNATAGGSPPQNATNVNVNATPRNDRNFAGERGENWALLDYKPTSISIRREVRVLLEKDQITVLPKNAPIPMPGPTAAVVDPAVKQIQTQIRQWGIAGKNMYWRPSLVVEVTPGAEPRFEELRSLLDGSGMEIRTEEWTVVKDAPTRR